MQLETNQTLARYEISKATLYNKRDVIEKAGGVIMGDGGSSLNLYDTSILDQLAREGKLGSKPRKAILNLDQSKEAS